MHRLVATVLVVLAACGDGPGDPMATGSAPPPCTRTGLISIGERLPDCRFEGIGGQPSLDLRSLSGKPAVINWWASWCTYCIEEMPDFEAVHADLGARVTIVGMNLLGGTQGETRGAAETFRERTGVTYRLAYDAEGRLYAQFQPNLVRPTMPITVFVDARGRVVQRHFGPFTEAKLRDAIAEAFGIS